MLVILPGAVRLPKKEFSHVKLPCRCNSTIICHNGIFDNGCDCSLYECSKCGLVVAVHEYWNMEPGMLFTNMSAFVGRV